MSMNDMIHDELNMMIYFKFISYNLISKIMIYYYIRFIYNNIS
jgi:hypothetical protein